MTTIPAVVLDANVVVFNRKTNNDKLLLIVLPTKEIFFSLEIYALRQMAHTCKLGLARGENCFSHPLQGEQVSFVGYAIAELSYHTRSKVWMFLWQKMGEATFT